jgi:hypothetical protein
VLRGAQEDLMEKGHLVAALEQERQQILQELEGYRARVGKEAGQDESKALMDMATTELQKLKTHNVALQEELSKKQLQLEVFVAAEEEREMRERETDLQTFAASFSASMSAADRLSQVRSCCVANVCLLCLPQASHRAITRRGRVTELNYTRWHRSLVLCL